MVGTAGYIAPEVVAGGIYDHQVDMWSVGVILYILLCGKEPFDQESIDVSMDHFSYNFDDDQWRTVSMEAKAVVRGLLNFEPSKRMRAEELVANSWVQGLVTPA